MGKRGPAKEPTAIKIAKGTAKREDLESLQHAPGAPRRPAWLEAIGDVACETWDETVAHLAGIEDLLSPAHERALAAYCIAWQRVHDAQEEIARDGITCYSEKGAQYQHPAVGIQNKAIETIIRLGAKFGMTPSDAQGLPMPAKQKQTVRRRG